MFDMLSVVHLHVPGWKSGFKIWDLIESVSEGFSSYSFIFSDVCFSSYSVVSNSNEFKNMLYHYYQNYSTLRLQKQDNQQVYQHPLIVSFKGNNSASFAIINGKCGNTLSQRPHSKTKKKPKEENK